MRAHKYNKMSKYEILKTMFLGKNFDIGFFDTYIF